MSDISSTIRQFIQTSPPGSDKAIINDIQTLLNQGDASKLINSALREYYTTPITTNVNTSGNVKLVDINGQLNIVSSYNMDSKGLKFVDYVNNRAFNYNFVDGQVNDIETLNLDLNSHELKELQSQLDQYVQDHYTELSVGIVVPCGSNYNLIIVGEKLSDGNFYNGKWVSVFQYNSQDGFLDAIIKVAVHYYEDGNVAMNSCDEFQIKALSINDVISGLNSIEHDFELQLLQKIGDLNEQRFKSLRRLLPISRSKIQWGKAIGNYKLGKDVVNNNINNK